jgi:hypothetical protein
MRRRGVQVAMASTSLEPAAACQAMAGGWGLANAFSQPIKNGFAFSLRGSHDAFHENRNRSLVFVEIVEPGQSNAEPVKDVAQGTCLISGTANVHVGTEFHPLFEKVPRHLIRWAYMRCRLTGRHSEEQGSSTYEAADLKDLICPHSNPVRPNFLAQSCLSTSTHQSLPGGLRHLKRQ